MWEVYKSDLLTYSRFTRTPTPDEGLHVLRLVSSWCLTTFGRRGPSQAPGHFWVISRDHRIRRWPPWFFRRSCSLGLCFRASNCILRSPEGEFPGLGRSRERPSPFGCARLPSLEPCKWVREHFRGWDRPPGVYSKVQSTTVAPRGRGPKPR